MKFIGYQPYTGNDSAIVSDRKGAQFYLRAGTRVRINRSYLAKKLGCATKDIKIRTATVALVFEEYVEVRYRGKPLEVSYGSITFEAPPSSGRRPIARGCVK